MDTIISWTIQYKGIPTGIEVSGAGHDDANGVYAVSGFNNNKLKFAKGTKYTIYSLRRTTGSRFYLSVGKTLLYYAENKNHESSLPPVTGWVRVREDKDQLNLTLRFTYD